MNLTSRKRKLVLVAPLLAAMGIAGFAGSKTANADNPDMTAQNERCAQRLSIALTGASPSAALIASTNPQSMAATLIASPDFQDRWSRFVNAQWNRTPGANPAEDAPYYLSLYVLQNGAPWSDMFLGQYDVNLSTDKKSAVVTPGNADGLGYFRSKAWLDRYSGNELAGYKLSTAYHLMNNTIGLQLVASTNAPGADVTASGRQAAPCNGCHYTPWYALDKVARGLTRVKIPKDANNVLYVDPSDGPTTILGDVTIPQSTDGDKLIVQALVNSDSFKFNTCRLAFNYLYGRNETSCEGDVFDKCMTAFASGKLQDAVAAVATDPTFCQN
ncbi:MAG: hypothetical protein ABI551_21895 [Polyangiaceae bacterium]